MNYEWQVLSYIWICDKTKQMNVVPCTLDDNGIVRSRETLNLLDVIIPLFSAGGIP